MNFIYNFDGGILRWIDHIVQNVRRFLHGQLLDQAELFAKLQNWKALIGVIIA